MDYDKLIENAKVCCGDIDVEDCTGRCVNPHDKRGEEVRFCRQWLIRDLYIAVETLRAENKRLKSLLGETGQELWSAENQRADRLQTERDTLLTANQHLMAEREQLTAERDAAVEEVKHLKAVMRDEGIVVIPPKYPWEKSKWNV